MELVGMELGGDGVRGDGVRGEWSLKSGRQKLGRPCQQAQHARLYSDLLQA